MTPEQHLERLAVEAVALRRAVDAADLNTPVPTCPGWTVRDVARHLGGIHRWVTRIVTEPVTEPWNPDQLKVVGQWPHDAALANWLDEGLGQLIDSLSTATEDLRCFAPLPAPSPRAMWCRRQLHETTVHRADIELATNGQCSPLDPDVAADCIDELLRSFVTRRHHGLTGIDHDATFVVAATDTPTAWTVHSHPHGITTIADRSPQPDDAITGTTETLALVLWSRLPPTHLASPGTNQFLTAWNATVHVRYS